MGREDKFYTLKVTISHAPKTTNREADIYTHIQSLSSAHAGKRYVRELREAFEIQGPDGGHWCLVHPVLGVSVSEWLEGFEGGKVPVGVMRGLVRSLLQALDFLHEEAGVIHTGTPTLFPIPFTTPSHSQHPIHCLTHTQTSKPPTSTSPSPAAPPSSPSSQPSGSTTAPTRPSTRTAQSTARGGCPSSRAIRSRACRR